MTERTLVSVLMTSYNRENYIAEAIESVLASSHTDFELIISDDASTDTTVQIARRYADKDNRIKVFVNPVNSGDYPNRNTAASYSKGKYIKYVDSDDTISQDGLYKMVSAMEAHPEAALGISQFDFEENIVYPQLVSSEQAYMDHYFGLKILSYGPIGAIIKREVFVALNGFANERYISDTEMWLKLSAIYPVVKIEPGVVEWRRHTDQEYHYGHNDYSYLRLSYPVFIASLNSKNCPLKPEDITIIKNRLQWKHARDILMLALKKGHFKIAYTIFKESGFNLFQLTKGFLPYSMVKKNFYHSV